jgi:hypothetical protein
MVWSQGSRAGQVVEPLTVEANLLVLRNAHQNPGAVGFDKSSLETKIIEAPFRKGIRGEVQVLLINHSQAPFVIKRGDRIAQMVVAPVTQIAWNVVEQLDQTERGSGGYGSTGIAAVAQ